jgi:hypothetical protein
MGGPGSGRRKGSSGKNKVAKKGKESEVKFGEKRIMKRAKRSGIAFRKDRTGQTSFKA